MPRQPLSALMQIINHIRLAWRLMRDHRAPLWAKAIPFLALGYVLWPLDLLADPILGLGQLDDLAILALGIKLFVSVCPPALVKQHLDAIGAPTDREGGQVIDAAYRRLDD